MSILTLNMDRLQPIYLVVHTPSGLLMVAGLVWHYSFSGANRPSGGSRPISHHIRASSWHLGPYYARVHTPQFQHGKHFLAECLKLTISTIPTLFDLLLHLPIASKLPP